MSASSPVPQAILNEYIQLTATNYVGVASFVSLVYDHIMTFDEEVEYIWYGSRGPFVYLFFANRYFFPLAFLLQLCAYWSPLFSGKVCDSFVYFEGSIHIIGLTISGLIMLLRVKAMYPNNKTVTRTLWALLILQIGSFTWFVSTGHPVPRSNGLHGCSLLFKVSLGRKDAFSVAPTLIYDTVVLALTIRRTCHDNRKPMSGSLTSALLEEGILYYSVIFTTNLVFMVMVATAPSGYRNILGQFAELLTATMMSRITLHMKKSSRRTVFFLNEKDGRINARGFHATQTNVSATSRVGKIEFSHSGRRDSQTGRLGVGRRRWSLRGPTEADLEGEDISLVTFPSRQIGDVPELGGVSEVDVVEQAMGEQA